MNRNVSQGAREFAIYKNPGELVNLCTFFYTNRLANAQEVIFSNSILKRILKIKNTRLLQS